MVACAEYLNNLSHNNSPFLSQSLVKYCLRYKQVKPTTLFEVTQSLCCILFLNSIGRIRSYYVRDVLTGEACVGLAISDKKIIPRKTK